MKTIEEARFNARLSKEQKEFFEYAAELAGFRTLTEFVIQATQKSAYEVVEKHNKILATEKDKEVFARLILNPPEPSESLKKLWKQYA
jgi:uncharacterized protein (DUF1778 family)